MLTDAAATRDAILNAFRTRLIDRSSPGDIALFYFAGHGSTRRTPQGDTEATIVPHDSRDPQGRVFDINSSELHDLFTQLLKKTANVTSILDSCFSNTAVRGAPTRSIAPDSRPRPGANLQARGIESLDPIAPAVRISASRLDQESEETADGKHGMLSFALFSELETAGENTTWRDAMDRARLRVAKQNSSQDPQLEAPNPDAKIFGGAGLAAKEPFFLITPRGKSAQVNGGSLHGLAQGAELEVYPPGTRTFEGDPLAKLAISAADDLTSEATVISGAEAPQIPLAARAVVRSRPPDGFRFRILFDGNSDAIVALKKQVLALVPNAEAAASRAEADVTVALTASQFRIQSPAGQPLSPPVNLSGADGMSHAQSQLAAWSRWHRLLKLRGGPPALELKITDGSGAATSRVSEGDQILLTLCNTGAVPYFTRVVDFSSDGSIAPLDQATDGAPIAPGVCKAGGSLMLTAPEGRESGVEIFKAFATQDKADLEAFTGSAIRGTEPAAAKWSAVERAVSVTKK